MERAIIDDFCYYLSIIYGENPIRRKFGVARSPCTPSLNLGLSWIHPCTHVYSTVYSMRQVHAYMLATISSTF